MFDEIFERFLDQSSVTVMFRGLLERIYSAKRIDALFEEYSFLQYTRELLFSDLVSVMMLVACGIRKTPSAAYKGMQEKLKVSRPAFYNKLKGIEIPVIQALLRDSAEQLTPVIEQLEGQSGVGLTGYRLKIIDGNVLGATEHRLDILQDEGGAPLPGKSMVVLDPQLRLAVDIVPCEDAYTQERSLLTDILPTVMVNDVWIGDRNLCTRLFLFGIAQREACFVIREHENLPWTALSELQYVEQSPTGKVFEQLIKMELNGDTLVLRRVVVELDKPTRSHENKVVILTNLPSVVGALKVSELYLDRWQVENLFQIVTEVFHCEIKTLGYPKAALFSFTIALVSYNLFAVLTASLSSVNDAKTVDATFSYYYVAEEIQATYHGMNIALPPEVWRPFGQMDLEEFCSTLKSWAKNIDLNRFAKATKKQSPKKSKRKFDPKRPHVSTARLLTKGASP